MCSSYHSITDNLRSRKPTPRPIKSIKSCPLSQRDILTTDRYCQSCGNLRSDHFKEKSSPVKMLKTKRRESFMERKYDDDNDDEADDEVLDNIDPSIIER